MSYLKKSLIVFFLSLSYAYSAETLVSQTGYYTLDWSKSAQNQSYRLLERTGSATAPPKTVYQGPNTKVFQSGKQDGDFFYTLLSVKGSEPLQQWHVKVRHHPFSFAMGLFAAGAAVFLITVASLIMLYRRTEQSHT